jgi:electron transfer flavoprotein alpha subunit
MKALLVSECRRGKLLESSYELLAFADKIGTDKVILTIGKETEVPQCDAKIYLADSDRYGEYNPTLHKELILAIAKKENVDYIVFLHSSYGWDLAPRVAASLRIAQVSEIVNVVDGRFEVTLCNAKLRRMVRQTTGQAVLTIQAGAFPFAAKPEGTPRIEKIEMPLQAASELEFHGYEPPGEKSVDLTKAEVIVSAGRGVGKKDNVPVIAALASALGGELGASRPVVDAGWVESSRQVGTTGQIVSPKLYIACGVSGAMQHLAGMKKSHFIVAINKDKEAPIREVADVTIVADVMQFVPVLMERLKKQS